jgi:hypothetical protein
MKEKLLPKLIIFSIFIFNRMAVSKSDFRQLKSLQINTEQYEKIFKSSNQQFNPFYVNEGLLFIYLILISKVNE